MSVLRRVFSSRVIFTLVCLFAIAIVSHPTTGQAFAAAQPPHQSEFHVASADSGDFFYHVEATQDFVSPVDAVGGYLNQQGVYVSSKPKNWSITQIFAGKSGCINGQCYDWVDAIEMGWVVEPAPKPDGYGDSNLHLFVFTRHGTACFNKNDSRCACQVYRYTDKSGNEQWTCNFHPVKASPLPGDSLQQMATPQEYLILHYHGAWWVGYQTGYIGYIPASPQWDGQFTQSDRAKWYGEVHSDTASPQVEMGNGICGSFNGSARIDQMFLVRSGKSFDAQAHLTVEEASNYYDSDKQLDKNNKGPYFNSFRYGGAGTVFQTNGSCPG